MVQSTTNMLRKFEMLQVDLEMRADTPFLGEGKTNIFEKVELGPRWTVANTFNLQIQR